MKIKKFKRIISAIMLILMLFSVVQPVFAASGSGRYSGGQYASNMKTTDNQDGTTGVLIRRLNNIDTGERKTVFCAEHGIEFATSVAYNGEYYTPTDSAMRRACKIAYLGWYRDYGDYTVDGGILAADMIWVKWAYVFTQQYIWETLGQSSATFINADEQAGYEEFKARINSEINSISARPSFNNQTITINAGESKTVTDTNGVLADYNSIDVTRDGIRYQHSRGSNEITITVDESVETENIRISDNTFQEWGMIKEGTEDHDTTVYFEFPSGIQDQLYAMHYNDPVTLNLALKIDTYGKLELQKLNSEGNLVDGATYNVSSSNGYNQDVEVRNGKITLDKLRKGIYTVKEVQAPYGYLLDTNSYNVEVRVSQTATQAITNEEPTGNFTLIKKNADKSAVLQNSTWRIWNDNYDQTFTTDSNGKFEVTGLKLGKYNYQETNAPEGYLVDENVYEFELLYKDQYTEVVYANAERTDDEPTATISIIKKDSETGSTPQGDAELKGAVYEVFAAEDIYNKARTKKFYSRGDLVATRTMNEKGETEDIAELPLGKYIVKEKTASKGYLLDRKQYEANLVYKDQNTKVITNKTTSNEDVKKMQLHIFKSGIKVQSGLVQGLEGAEFTIKLNSAVERAYLEGYTYAEVWGGIDEEGNNVDVNADRVSQAQVIAPTYEIITTDSEGNAYTQNKLPFGKYIVKETKTPTDFRTAVDFSFSITKDESEVNEVAQKAIHLVVNDEQFESYIKLVKKDLKSNKVVTLNSATFEIKAASDIIDRGNGKTSSKSSESTVSYKGSDNNYLSNIIVDGYELNKTFSKENETYFVKVAEEIQKIDIDTTVEDDSAKISIYGNEELKTGTNKVLINVTAENGNVRTYRIYVTK